MDSLLFTGVTGIRFEDSSKRLGCSTSNGARPRHSFNDIAFTTWPFFLGCSVFVLFFDMIFFVKKFSIITPFMLLSSRNYWLLNRYEYLFCQSIFHTTNDIFFVISIRSLSLSSTMYHKISEDGNGISHESEFTKFRRDQKNVSWCGYVVRIHRYTRSRVYCLPLRFITKRWRCNTWMSSKAKASILSVNSKSITIARNNTKICSYTCVWLSPPNRSVPSFIELEADIIYLFEGESGLKLNDLVYVHLLTKWSDVVVLKGIVTEIGSTDYAIIKTANISHSVRYRRVFVKIHSTAADTSAFKIFYWKAELFLTNRKNVWYTIAIIWSSLYLSYYILKLIYWAFL